MSVIKAFIVTWKISGAVKVPISFPKWRTRVQRTDGCVDKITSFAIYLSMRFVLRKVMQKLKSVNWLQTTEYGTLSRRARGTQILCATNC
jgi:hypothetical protein